MKHTNDKSRLERISFRKRKRILAGTVMGLMMCIIGAFTVSSAHAAASASTFWNFLDSASAREKASEGFGDVDAYFSDSSLGETNYDELRGELVTSTSVLGSIHGIINSDFYYQVISKDRAPGSIVANGLKGIGLYFAAIFMIVQMLVASSRQELTGQMWMRYLMIGIMAMSLIMCTDIILNGIDTFGHTLGVGVYSYLVDNNSELAKENGEMDLPDNVGEDVVETTAGTIFGVFFQKLSLGDAVSTVSTRMQQWVMNVIVRLVLQGTLYAMLIATFTLYMELCIRRAFMPLAIAVSITDSARGVGIRYFLVYGSVYVRMAMFYLIGAGATLMEYYALSGTDATSVTNPFMKSIGAVICIRLAATAMLKNTGSVARDVMGV